MSIFYVLISLYRYAGVNLHIIMFFPVIHLLHANKHKRNIVSVYFPKDELVKSCFIKCIAK